MLLAALAAMSTVAAQHGQPFASPSQWQKLQTEHIEVYFLPGEEEGAARVARYAELARYELSVFFDYKPQSTYSFVYVANPLTLLHSNIDLTQAERSPGVFPFPRHYGVVTHPGTTRGLYQAVKRQTALVLLREFAYGDRIGSALQTEMLLYDAPWVREGLAEYLATGWQPEDDMWMSTLSPSEYLTYAMEGDGPLHRIVRKSIWYFIDHEYDDQKISEIIYLLHNAHSIESGIISVLGISSNTMTGRWHDFMRGIVLPQQQGRTHLAQVGEVQTILLDKGWQILSFAYNPQRQLLAIYADRLGSQELMLYDIEERRFLPSILKGGTTRQTAALLDYRFPMAWDGSGHTLVSTAYVRGQYRLVYYDAESQALSQEAVPDDIQLISALSWSHDGSRIAASALRRGQVDLYMANGGTAALRALTSDAFDEVEPTWSFDDQSLFFSSNRDTTALRVSGDYWDSYTQTFDLYQYPVGASEPADLKRITATPYVNERSPLALTSYALAYLSDESGIQNLRQINIFQGQDQPLSDLAFGLEGYYSFEGHLALMAPHALGRTIYLLELAAIKPAQEPEPTLLRLDLEDAYRLRARRQQAAPGQGPTPQPALQQPAQPQPETSTTTRPQAADSARESQPVRYYIFDDEDTPYEVRNSQQSLSIQTPQNQVVSTFLNRTPPPVLDDIDVSEATRATRAWRADYLTLGLNYDPIAKLGPEFGLGFKDLPGRHQIDVVAWPSFNLRNSETRVRYSYLPRRIDFYAEAGQWTRRVREANALVVDSSNFRFDRYSLDLGARYPLSGTSAVGLSLGFVQAHRRDLQLLRTDLLDSRNNLLRAGLHFDYDKVRYTEGFRQQGLEVEALVESYFSLTNSQFAFQRGRLDLSHYQPVLTHAVLATSLQAAITTPKVLRQYYMGGVQTPLVRPVYLRGGGETYRPEVADSTLMSIPFIDFVMPVRGFLPNTRNGSRYVAANFELRLPVSRMLRHSLPTKSLYNFELIPFVDAGTVWVDGNPFSQKKPTDTQYIVSGPITVKLQTLKSPFLIGFGSGLRTNILDWSLRMDLAWGLDDYVVQRPVLYFSAGKDF
ncbi:MAG: hypothetical protein OHK0039_24270 [Bacteroidia bacterium]